MGGDYDVLFIGHTPAKIGEACYNINTYQPKDKTMDPKGLYNFIMLLLKDDDGISEDAYQQLIEHLIEINQPEIIIELNSKSRTANGRRYINEY